MSILPWRRKNQPTQFERAADGSMTLMEHLRELRSRLFKASLGILLGFGFGWWLAPPVRKLLDKPYCDLMRSKGQACNLIQIEVTSTFVLQMKIALWIGLIIAGPIWLYQLWAFVAPGLHRHERKWAYLFAGLAAPLFGLGAVLAYFVVAKGLDFLLKFNGPEVTTSLEVTRYIDFVTGLMLLFGIAFEFPLGIMLANIAGVITARRLLGWWRIAIFLFFVFAAIATPTADPFGMSFLALALSLLYFGAVGFAAFNDRRRRRRQPAYANIGDDEISSLDDYSPEPVAGPTSIDGLDPIDRPEPIAKPLPIERRYDDIT